MLPRKRRITTALFDTVLEKGFTFYSPHFSLRLLKVPGEESRFSVAVSKKVAKKAVVRNLFRRRTRSAIEKLLPTLASGYHGIFFVKTSIDTVLFKDLFIEVETLLKKMSR